MWADKIKKYILDEYNLKPTDPGFIAKYSGAVTEVIKGASQEEIKELQNYMEDWNAEQVAEEIQHK